MGDEPRKHLLIVDDEPVILQILETVFEDEPYELTLCANGTDALAVIRSRPVNVLLTDKNLPDVSGMELLTAIKAKDPIAEVIILTGYASLETALAAMQLDAFDYILKPPQNVFEIRKKVRQAIEKQAIVLENQRLIGELQHKNGELEAALEETRALQDELIQTEKLAGIGTLAAGIAHEISSPLFGAMGLAEAIADEADLALAQGYARDIVEYCRSIRDIVVELSSYSRASTSEYLTTVELARVIGDALKLVERSVDVSGIQFEMDLAPNLYLNARTNEVQQVFVNLVKNAAEAVREVHGASGAGRVTVKAGRNENGVWATVADNGAGIPEEKKRQIFDPFYTTKPPGKGTGLGLNIVFRIITKYRGGVSVQSELGLGSVFEVRFPVEK